MAACHRDCQGKVLSAIAELIPGTHCPFCASLGRHFCLCLCNISSNLCSSVPILNELGHQPSSDPWAKHSISLFAVAMQDRHGKRRCGPSTPKSFHELTRNLLLLFRLDRRQMGSERYPCAEFDQGGLLIPSGSVQAKAFDGSHENCSVIG